MGGKSSGSDMRQAAAAQGAADKEVNRDQTFANRPNQYTPWGYTSWNPYQTTDPATGESVTGWEQVTGLTPELQDILNKQIAVTSGRSDIAGAMTGRLGSEFGQAMDWENFAPMAETPLAQMTTPTQSVGDPYQTRQRAEDAVYNQAMSRLQPRFEANRQQAEVRMRNQGLRPGDAAWQAQMQNLQQQETDATNQALWSSVGEGRAESGQMFDQMFNRNAQDFGQALSANQQNFGQMMDSSGYANTLRQQQIAEAMGRRGQSLNEINALLSGQQVGMPQFPGFTGASRANAAPIYQAAADAASINAANSPWGALAGLGGSLFGAAGASGGFGGLF